MGALIGGLLIGTLVFLLHKRLYGKKRVKDGKAYPIVPKDME